MAEGALLQWRGSMRNTLRCETSIPLSFARICLWSTDNKSCLSQSRQICHVVDGSQAHRALWRRMREEAEMENILSRKDRRFLIATVSHSKKKKKEEGNRQRQPDRLR